MSKEHKLQTSETTPESMSAPPEAGSPAWVKQWLIDSESKDKMLQDKADKELEWMTKDNPVISELLPVVKELAEDNGVHPLVTLCAAIKANASPEFEEAYRLYQECNNAGGACEEKAPADASPMPGTGQYGDKVWQDEVKANWQECLDICVKHYGESVCAPGLGTATKEASPKR